MSEATEPAKGPDATAPAETGIQAGAPGLQVEGGARSAESGALSAQRPAPSAPPSPARRRGFNAAGLDRVLLLLLLILTFFLGSFAARNADFLTDLATGRLIAHGEYRFGTDPFAYGTEERIWVNHAWLFDWLVYMLWSTAGDAGPVIFKAALLVALTLVLVALRRPGKSLWVPILCTGLAMLALSPRALMQSTSVSFLFLGITIYLLTKSSRIWILPILFAFWVNLDGWFLLGPLTVAWYLIGSVGQRLSGQTPRHCPARLGIVLLVGIAACLINPYTYRAFTLPPELAYMAVQAGDALPSWITDAGRTIDGLIKGEQLLPRNQQMYRLAWQSPLAEGWRSRSELGNNVAGMAYFGVLMFGLLSFVVPAVRNARSFAWPRFLVWLFFAFLSLVQVRLIPFFAVVNGAIMALNFQEYWTGDETAPARRPSVLGRLATVFLFLALIFLAWPGWLHARIYPFDFHAARRVAWKIDFDPSLHEAAERLDKLRERGVIHHGFAFSPDVACYCAWFAPQVKGFIDYRYALFPDRAEPFARARLAVASPALENRDDPNVPTFNEWRHLAEKYAIDYLVLTNFSRGSNMARLSAASCWLDHVHWAWLYGDGRTLIFRWNQHGGRLAGGETIAPDQLAFGTVPESQRAPGAGARLPEGLRNFWESYLDGTAAPPLELDRADQFQVYRNLFSVRLQGNYLRVAPYMAFHGPVALSVAAPASITVPAAFGPPVFPARRDAPSLLQYVVQRSLFGPASVPVLMTRDVRRALAGNPSDPPAYEVLANSIELESFQEDTWSLRREPTFRQQMRQLQLIAAWTSYLKLKPDDPRAHMRLKDIYLQLGYLDVALEHVDLALKNWHKQSMGPAPQAREQLEMERKQLEGLHKGLEQDVKNRQMEFDLRATGMAPLQKALLALGSGGQGGGLALKALSALQRARPDEVGGLEASTLVSLLLRFGEIREVNEGLPALKGLGPIFSQYQVFCAAAAGEYDRADSVIADHLKRSLPFLLTFECMKLAPNQGTPGIVLQCYRETRREIAAARRQLAEWHLVRGLLALERGDTALATQSFRNVKFYLPRGVPMPEANIAVQYLSLLQDNRK